MSAPDKVGATSSSLEAPTIPKIAVRDLTMAYGDFVVQREINFEVPRGQVLVIMGGSGCGKSTLLKHMIGLKTPAEGTISYDGERFDHLTGRAKEAWLKRFGVLYQSGALWSSMTLAENVALPLELYSKLRKAEIDAVVRYKLALVGLAGSEHLYPSEISGGMRKRAGLARAMALDPEILFFDEPSAGLDPITSRRLDDTILQLKAGTGATIVIVTHELPSLFAVADWAIFLDARERRMTAQGDPKEMLKNPPNDAVYEFLTRNKTEIPAWVEG